jgi:hypothetical protein
MSLTPDWIWRSPEKGGTYETPDWTWEPPAGSIWEVNQGAVTPGIFHIGATVMPMDSRLARRGVKGVLQQVTPAGDIKAIVHLRRGLFGWYARRWMRKHPLQYSGEMYRPEWGEWRDVTGKVEVVP